MVLGLETKVVGKLIYYGFNWTSMNDANITTKKTKEQEKYECNRVERFCDVRRGGGCRQMSSLAN